MFVRVCVCCRQRPTNVCSFPDSVPCAPQCTERPEQLLLLPFLGGVSFPHVEAFLHTAHGGVLMPAKRGTTACNGGVLSCGRDALPCAAVFWCMSVVIIATAAVDVLKDLQVGQDRSSSGAGQSCRMGGALWRLKEAVRCGRPRDAVHCAKVARGCRRLQAICCSKLIVQEQT